MSKNVSKLWFLQCKPNDSVTFLHKNFSHVFMKEATKFNLDIFLEDYVTCDTLRCCSFNA